MNYFQKSYSNKYYNLGNYIDNNNERLLEEYNSNLKKIKELKSKLIDYDSKINEITELNMEINPLNNLIESKNKIIYEYELLSQKAKEKFKFISYLNGNKENNDYRKLKQNNEILLEIYNYLKEANNYYKKEAVYQLNNN